VICSRCGSAAHEGTPYCRSCGAPLFLAATTANSPQILPPEQAQWHQHHIARANGFSQIFGIHPSVAILALIVDTMLFGGEVATAGAILPISIGAGAVLGVVAYLTQKKWYGDDHDSALIKALILGFLTAIPAPLPAILSVPTGILGLIHTFRKK
jgi:hypothetical protein